MRFLAEVLILASILAIASSGAFYLTKWYDNSINPIEYDTEESELTLYVDELEQDEQKIAKSLVYALNSDCKIGHDFFYFTKNLSEHSNRKNASEKWKGFNRGGEIFVKYTGDITQMKRTITHEIFHTYMISGNNTHNLIYKIASTEICYG